MSMATMSVQALVGMVKVNINMLTNVDDDAEVKGEGYKTGGDDEGPEKSCSYG